MNGRNKPRRAGARWREGAPSYVLDCFDNKGKTADRYTVMFAEPVDAEGEHWPYLGMSGAPTHPQGFSQWGELTRYQLAAYRYARGGRERVRWLDLPEHIRAHVIARWEQAEAA